LDRRLTFELDFDRSLNLGITNKHDSHTCVERKLQCDSVKFEAGKTSRRFIRESLAHLQASLKTLLHGVARNGNQFLFEQHVAKSVCIYRGPRPIANVFPLKG
jgi:hypothetical protein